MALDTHVVVWLHAGEVRRIPPGVRDRIESQPLVICAMVKLELAYLYGSGKIRLGADEIVSDLASHLGLAVCRHPLQAVIQTALRETWTRDPFDRIIAAHAMATGYPLATKDDDILEHCPAAVWE